MEKPSEKQPAAGFTIDASGKKVPVVANADGSVTAASPAAGSASEWQCAGCNEMMGGSAQAYCAKCAEDDPKEPDGDDDEEEAKALGLDAKATRAERINRAAQLSAFEREVCETTSSKSWAEALGKVSALSKESSELAAIKVEKETLQTEGIRRDLRAHLERGLTAQNGQAPRLSLGGIQKSLSVVLRGEQKNAWTSAMAKLDKVTKETVLDAACSVVATAEGKRVLGAEDVAAIGEFIQGSSPIAAEAHGEPPRDPEREGAELNETESIIKAAADAARKTLDRGMKAAPTK